MASLADKSVDHVITDPPYSERVHGKQWIGAALTASGGKRMSTAHAGLGFDALTPEVLGGVLSHAARLTKRWSLLFSDLESVATIGERGVEFGLEHVRICIWDKVDSAPQFTGDRPANGAEAIEVLSQPGKKRWNAGGARNVYRFAVNGDRGAKPHPSTKPEALMEKLIRDFTDRGDTILDPFAGSGTTGVIAIRLGRKFIGFEKDPKYYDIAMRRLSAAREQMEVFGEARTHVKERRPEQGILHMDSHEDAMPEPEGS